MSIVARAEDIPFVNEECGDTMWDLDLLDQLNETTTNQLPAYSTITSEKTFPPGQALRDDTNRSDASIID